MKTLSEVIKEARSLLELPLAVMDPAKSHGKDILKAFRDAFGLEGNALPAKYIYITKREGSSNKFHYIAVFKTKEGFAVGNAHGRIGAKPLINIIGTYMDAGEAYAAFDTKVKEKMRPGKGYVQTKMEFVSEAGQPKEVGWYVMDANDRVAAGPFDSEMKARNAAKSKGGDAKGFDITYFSDYDLKRSHEAIIKNSKLNRNQELAVRQISQRLGKDYEVNYINAKGQAHVTFRKNGMDYSYVINTYGEIKKVREGFAEADKKWIQKAIKRPGALKKAFPKLAKDGFTNKELQSIKKHGTAKQKKQATLAMTLKKFGRKK